MPSRRTIDVQDTDQDFLAAWHHQLWMLCGMVREMVVEDKKLLLSPLMRELLANKAALVEGTLCKLKNILCADNLGKPLAQEMPGFLETNT